MDETSSSNETRSSWNSESDISNSGATLSDPFEGIIYRTHAYQSKFSIHFVYGVFFETFKDKIHADYMNSIDIDQTNFVSKCTTHVKGAKCDIKLDSHFKTVDLSGIGYQLWRDKYFPRITRTLFKQLMRDLDSQLEDVSQCKPGSEDATGNLSQPDIQTSEAATTTTDVNVAPNLNVAPKSNVAESDTPNLNIVPKSNVVESEISETVEFTAENITSSYMQGVQMAKTIGQQLLSGIDDFARSHNTDQVYGNEGDNLTSQGQIPCRIDNREAPVFTSTPITLRPNDATHSGAASQNICAIINKIDQLDGGIQAIRRDILQQMQYKLDELKSSVVMMIEKCASRIEPRRTSQKIQALFKLLKVLHQKIFKTYLVPAMSMEDTETSRNLTFIALPRRRR